jgi:hypothetical protein
MTSAFFLNIFFNPEELGKEYYNIIRDKGQEEIVLTKRYDVPKLERTKA